MLLDTLPFLKSAINLYKKYGFYQIESYNDSPMADSIFMKLDLCKCYYGNALKFRYQNVGIKAFSGSIFLI